MATIQFTNCYSWDNLPKTESRRVISIDTFISRLEALRTEWQKVAESEGVSLFEIQASVGLLLTDFCNMLELTSEEIQTVLSQELREVIL